MATWWSEFKKFALQGNMVDLAIGVVIGAAFGKVVSSLVNDIIMPPLGVLMGGVDFSDKVITLKTAVLDAHGKEVHPAAMLKYGTFINNIIDFLIVAFSIFLVIKLISMAKHKPSAAPATKDCPKCLSTIPINASRCAHCCADIA
ncbi:MAG TPA: large-conductance mechanosensitive channel protein MscL [Tepidisphaeraceae bacterium]|jgi:large conductance mechanosensitive channel